MIGGGLAGSVVLAGAIIWGISVMGSRGVPLIETDGRPYRVRPDSPGGAVVPNQQELIFERGAGRTERTGQVRLGPGPETPRPEAMNAQPQPQTALQTAPVPAATLPVAPAAIAPAAPPRAVPEPAQQAARPAPAAGGRAQVQLLAASTEEGARTDWARLQRRVPELSGRAPVITKLEREGQSTLWRLRTGGFADAAAARAFCAQLRERSIACNPVNG